MSRHWKTRSTKELFTSGIFRLRVDECDMPDGRIMPRYYVMEFPDWVNIVPVTREGNIVLVEQFRHAAGEMTWEIPGGSTDHRERELPERAAARELLEETGYKPTRTQLVMSHHPNPAMQNNFMHTFIGWDCARVAEPTPDPYEDIIVKEFSVSEVYEMVRAGKIRHTIVIASLLLALPHLGFTIPAVRA